MDYIKKDAAQAAVEQVFREYEITDASISSLDLIILDIMKVITKVDQDAYDRGYNAGSADSL